MPILSALSDQELQSLEIRWYEGRMLPYVDWLLQFTQRNRAEILQAAGQTADVDALIRETERRILSAGSIHLAAELNDQRREMECEVWYRGERGDQNRAAIQSEWCARYAPAWRQWRIQEYLFVTRRCKWLIIDVLLNASRFKARSE